MKKTLSLLGVFLLGGFLAAETASAGSITNTVAQLVGSTPITFNFAKFDQSLGMLTAVNFTIVSSVDNGSLWVNNTSASSARIRNAVDSLLVVDNQGSGADYASSPVTLTTTPSTSGTGNLLPALTSLTYTLAANQTLVSDVSFDIDSIFWGSYSSSNGSGSVSFDVQNGPSITVSSGTASFDTTNVKANTTLQLTYTYNAVPEASTYALFGLGGMILLITARRKRAA